MANNYMDTSLFDRAAHFAIDAHHNTERRGHNFPYVLHVMEAATIVATMTTDQELLAAAVLHDTIEDCDVSKETLASLFGDRVAEIVASESDNGVGNAPQPGAPWRERKEYAIATLSAENLDAKMVALGDKLSNIRIIARDFNIEGDKLWDKFHADDPSDHEWHYRELAKALKDLEEYPAYHEFVALIEDTFKRCAWNR